MTDNETWYGNWVGINQEEHTEQTLGNIKAAVWGLIESLNQWGVEPDLDTLLFYTEECANGEQLSVSANYMKKVMD